MRPARTRRSASSCARVAGHASATFAPPVALATLAMASVSCVGADPCAAHELGPIARPHLAVVLSDYASSAIAIVESDGVVTAPWIDSGSRPPELVAALSGDVVLPRSLPRADALAIVDRYQTDVLTEIPYAAPEALAQHDLRGGRTSGASPNPQDVLALEDGRWLVSRHNPAEAPAAPELARGNDLAILDEATHELVGRIDLGADVELEGVRYFARPSGLVRMHDGSEERVLVGLARLSSLVLRLTGPGAVALLDPRTSRVAVLELEGLSNCTTVASFPRDDARAMVLCRGDAFGEDEARGGLVEIALDAGVLVERRRFAVSADASLPPPGNGLVPLDATRVAYVSSGSVIEGRLDRLVLLDVTTGETSLLLESGPEPFMLGDGVLDGDALLVPDGNAHAIRRFAIADLVEGEPIVLGGACATLPPRQVVVVR
ncbi:MAG: hypothetical protein K1X94_22805 [Sandaracinaceae bacterium]|nr:hypothetical protein [Sandaracinaceae bacterium]